MRRSVSFLLKVVVPVLLVAAAASAAWLYTQLETPYYGASEGETLVRIPRGMDTGRIAGLLAESGILRNRIPFVAYMRWTGDAGRVRAGEYRFTEPASPRQIARRLVSGDVFFRAVTIPEGLTAMETVGLLARNGFGDRLAMESALGKTEWISDLAPEARNLEGYLFPETYHFDRKADSERILRTMVDQFRKKFGAILSDTPPPAGWTPSRAVILASMIEKEAQKEQERPLISSVYHNRLRIRMPLGCDATIIYALKLGGTWNGNIRKSDLSIDSPYNTYRNTGLPPGPIANPGAGSLRAALNPSDTEYLFYVSRNDGTHVFSKNYRDHQNAVNTYQRLR